MICHNIIRKEEKKRGFGKCFHVYINIAVYCFFTLIAKPLIFNTIYKYLYSFIFKVHHGQHHRSNQHHKRYLSFSILHLPFFLPQSFH